MEQLPCFPERKSEGLHNNLDVKSYQCHNRAGASRRCRGGCADCGGVGPYQVYRRGGRHATRQLSPPDT
ncbi:hypothetical protein O3P69_003627 [Scylla paramamosain]|uniref:Uncharacterized protein n=1 Tax=Scylla paramamosain TaxID=85552 RepID=A0AAW0UI22_SCYPA